MSHDSGTFVIFDRGAGEELGLVLRSSSNTHADDSVEEYVELAPLDKILLRDEQVRPFNEPAKPDSKKIVSNKSGEVTGVSKGK